MSDKKPLFKSPYDIKDVSALFALVAFVLIIAAIIGNNLFGLFQEKVNFGLIKLLSYWTIDAVMFTKLKFNLKLKGDRVV